MSRTAAGQLDQLAINAIRFLSVDMVEKAASGHPGAPMGQAPMAYLLWTRHLRHNPADPAWANRDRFILSSGHASALLYSLLHLAGYDLPAKELERFRQWGSRTPGHPEHGPGIETTTGPLGQGIANAFGLALAEAMAAARFNRPGFPVVDFRTWVIASDGDMMEGVASEACSLAGHLRLGKLNVLYDDNEISIDGATSLAFSEDVGRRFEAYGWHVQRVTDGNDLDALEKAMETAKAEAGRPSLIVVRTVIGYGSPGKQGTAEAHGAPLGSAEAAATKRALGWPEEPAFYVPEEAQEAFAPARERGREEAARWSHLLAGYRAAHPELAADFERRLAGELPEGWEEALPTFSPADGALATRSASGKVLGALAARLPELVGGSADLTPSNNTQVKGRADFSADDPSGLYLRFGVREHAMGSAMNGLALSGLWRPYGGTFLIFSDYMRPAIRLAALMGLPVVYVFTHDSVFLGEDGPTHQPVEHLAALRAIPNLTLLRPADACETVEAWRLAAAHRTGPVVLALTRQNVPILEETAQKAREGVCRGAYVLCDPEEGPPQAILIATGSEVFLARDAHRQLATRGIRTRLVSMPSTQLFDRQPREYRDAVLPPAVTRRLAIEAASPFGWHKYVGGAGEILGLDRFGASAPYKVLAEKLGFTVEAVVARVEAMVGRG